MTAGQGETNVEHKVTETINKHVWIFYFLIVPYLVGKAVFIYTVYRMGLWDFVLLKI